MKLSREEEIFLGHWMYEEMQYRAGPGPAKRLQFEHDVLSSDLAAVIAASIPLPAAQEAAGDGPPPAEPPIWPWFGEVFTSRLAEARTLLAQRSADGLGFVPRPGKDRQTAEPGPVETNPTGQGQASASQSMG